MGIFVHHQLDPAAECVRYLSMNHTVPEEDRDTARRECQRLTERSSIPSAVLESLTAPVRAMEAELSAALDHRQDLWGEMFYPGSDDNLLAWGFFMLERMGDVPSMPLLALRRYLATFMLCLDYGQVSQIESLDGLMALLQTADCSVQAKWLCTQVWQDPRPFYDKYRAMVALAEPIVQGYAAAMQPYADEVVEKAAGELEADFDLAWNSFEMERSSEELEIVPLCIDFNGRGICCDETTPNVPAYWFIGVFTERIRQLALQYGNQAKFLSEQLKTVTDQSRLEILMALKNGPLCGQDLAEHLHRTPGTISHHMSQLVKDGFVTVTKHGSKIHYGLQHARIEELLNSLHKALV